MAEKRIPRRVKDNPPYQFRSALLSFLALALIAFAVVAAPLRAETVHNVATVPESGATIRLASPWTQNPRFGFAPVRVWIENRAPSERTWRLQFQAGMRNFSIGVLNSEYSVTVPAGHTRDVWIFVPVAEPGLNMGPGSTVVGWTPPPGAPTLAAAPIITRLPGGKGTEVVRLLNNPDGTTTTIKTAIDTTAGTIITTTISAAGAVVSHTQSFPLKRSTVVTIPIDPETGLVGTPRTRTVPGDAPPRVSVATPGTPSRRGGRTAPTPGIMHMGAIGPSSPMMLMAEITGPGVQTSGRINFPGSTSGNGMRPFAVSPALEPVFRSQLASLVSGAPNLSAMDPAQLPADWRVWSSFSGVLLTTDEYAALDQGRRAALRGWVALGGQLCLSPPTSGGLVAGAGGTEKLGAGVIVTLEQPVGSLSAAAAVAPPAAEPVKNAKEVEKARMERVAVEAAARRAARLGHPVSPAAAALAAKKPEEFYPLGREVRLFESTNGLPDQSAFELDPFGPLAEQVKDEGGESPWLAAFLVVFAVVVGPVNLFLFAPANKRHRLFLTTPLIALTASVLLAVAILVQDGIGGSGVRRTLVVLLPGENQTAVFQEQAVRTGFLLGRTFTLPEDVQFTILPLDAPTWGGPETTFLRQGARMGGDWFRNRARQVHLLQRLAPTRGRLERVGTDASGAPILQSSLGATLRDFVCLGDDGETWKTAELAPGHRVTLERGGTWLGTLSGPLLPGGSHRFKQVFDKVAQDVPGRWCARGTPAELAPIPTLGSVRWKDSDVIYAGSLETSAAAGTPTEPVATRRGQP